MGAIIVWLVMLIMNLLIPGIMIFCANDFLNGGGDVNKFYGYRTKMSMINKETWKFAHMFCGNLWKRWGKAMLRITLIVMAVILAFTVLSILISLDSETTTVVVAVTCSAIMVVQLVVIIGSIFPVEKALNKKFDKEGNLRV